MTKQLILISILLAACSSDGDKILKEKARQDIVQTELDFALMAKSKGLSEAFTFYADPAAALNRGSYVIHGKDSIRLFYLAERYKGVKLEWKPDYVEVSSAGDLGYTYGKYIFTSFNQTGQAKESKGIFHTVWKKQADGQWRYVWD